MKSYEIRQLVENYYDIQKIRVETFNRLVCWVKENKEKIKEYLKSHLFGETHKEDASQHLSETQFGCASQSMFETQFKVALKLLEDAEKMKGVKGMRKYSEFVKRFVLSHTSSGNHIENASQHLIETHVGGASHFKNETQIGDASQINPETHIECASHHNNGTQSKIAPVFPEIENLVWFHNRLYEMEKELQERLDVWSRNHKLRKEFLNYVKGIGGVLASGIIAWLDEVILKAEHPSSVWKYCGLYPGSERKKGEKLPYNLKLKTFCWKIGQSFIKFKCFGRKLYEKFKEETKQKHPDWSKLHIHNYVRRKVVKVFLACLWKKWREMNNLPTPEPYAIAYLKHSDLVTPEMWMEKVEK